MNIGKREQIVIGSIATIALIGTLHFFIFAPGVGNFKAAKAARDQSKGNVPGLKTISSPEQLTKFEETTSITLTKMEKGITQLKLDEPECFLMHKLDDIKVDPASLKPGDPAPDIVKKMRFDEENKKKGSQQLDLVMAEIGKLRAAVDNGRVTLSFMGNGTFGWNIPKDLPPQMNSGNLWDQIKMVAYIKDGMDHTDPKSVSYRQLMLKYKQSLGQMHIDLDWADRMLKSYGAFVPIIYRLMFADMILKRMAASPTPITIGGTPLTRETLFGYLQIEMPYDKLDGLDENKVYFLFEGLRNLNYMIAMAQQQGIKDITGVTFRGYGFVHEQVMPAEPDPAIPDIEKLPDDEFETAAQAADALAAMDAAAAAAAAAANPTPEGQDPNAPPVDQNADMSAMATPVPLPTQPHEGDLGYAIPIRITFVAPNANGMGYLYEILRDKPLAELHRLILRSTSMANTNLSVPVNPNSTDVEMTATMLFVPKLFKTKDEVIRIIDSIRSAAKVTPTPAPPK